ncbi:MAG: peptide ABC transporter permease, partial [Pseudomonadota bacterium]|nr:peptide ABC transporter permease [Pseudomonadota bacterium]
MPQFSLYDEEFHPSPWQRTWASFRASHIAMLGLTMLALFVMCALFAPIITPYDAVEQNIDGLLIPPSWLANGSISH